MMRKVLLAGAFCLSAAMANAAAYTSPPDDPTVGNFNPGGAINDRGGLGNGHSMPDGAACGLLCMWWGAIKDRVPEVIVGLPPEKEPEGPIIPEPCIFGCGGEEPDTGGGIIDTPDMAPVPLFTPLVGMATAFGSLGGLGAWAGRRKRS